MVLSSSTFVGSVDEEAKGLIARSSIDSGLSPEDQDYREHGRHHSSVVPMMVSEGDGYHGTQRTVSTVYLMFLTCSTLGLQVVWSVLMSNGTPYLISLGLSKTLTALVWIAGPLSGAIVQPLVGVHSDRSRHPWGQRKPYIIGGGACTIICMLALSCTKDLVCLVGGLMGVEHESDTVRTITIIVAILWVYALNIAIQPLQSGIRAFIVDNCPAHQQVEASAWASRFTGIGSILGYIAGFTCLPDSAPLLGNTEFKALAVIAALALIVTIALSCFLIREKDPRLLEDVSNEKGGATTAIFRQVLLSMKTMPIKIRRVCEIQFFAWMGWFPFLFYTTTYIGELYANPIVLRNPGLTGPAQDAIWSNATRIGTFAFLIFALVALFVNLVLPHFLDARTHREKDGRPLPIPSTRLLLASYIKIPGLTLSRAWTLAHILFSACMFSTIFIHSRTGGTVLVGLVGISWALTIWAPFAIISTEIAQLGLRRSELEAEEPESRVQEQVGAIMGLHNMAIAAPQIVAALMCSIAFCVLHLIGVQDSLGWVLRGAGVAGLVAAYLSNKLE